MISHPSIHPFLVLLLFFVYLIDLLYFAGKMDYNEQQMQEIEALESMYGTDELRILCRDYPNICVEVDVRPDMADLAALIGSDLITLRASLPAEYPECSPNIELGPFADENEDDQEDGSSPFWQEIEPKVMGELGRTAEESQGMPMLFTLVSTLQDFVIELAENHIKNRDELERKRADQAEQEERARFEGTRVTVESFKEWNKKFMAEIRAKKSREQREQESQLANRLTGKQLFLADQSLNISDLQFLDAANTGEGEAAVEIDQSLFEDDLDLDDSDEENDPDYKTPAEGGGNES